MSPVRHSLGAACLLLPSAARATQSPPSWREAVAAYVAPYVQMNDFSGTILILRPGKDSLISAFGFADRARGTPNRADTRYGIGSLTKTFTAAAVAMLAERGQLSPREPVGRVIPGVPHVAGGMGVAVFDGVRLGEVGARPAAEPPISVLRARLPIRVGEAKLARARSDRAGRPDNARLCFAHVDLRERLAHHRRSREHSVSRHRSHADRLGGHRVPRALPAAAPPPDRPSDGRAVAEVCRPLRGWSRFRVDGACRQ